MKRLTRIKALEQNAIRGGRYYKKKESLEKKHLF